MTTGVRPQKKPEAATDNRIAPNIELVYDRDCPNVGDCRDALRSALTEFGAHPSWGEWDRNSFDTPTAYRSYGSPTVLVNGRDIHALAQGVEADGNSCRVYANDDSDGISGVPSVTSIVHALIAAANIGAVMQGGTPNGTPSGAPSGTQSDTRPAVVDVRCAC